MKQTTGTPKTLIGAIHNGLALDPELSDLNISAHVRDFLSQRFSVAMINHPEEAKMLKALFEEIVK